MSAAALALPPLAPAAPQGGSGGGSVTPGAAGPSAKTTYSGASGNTSVSASGGGVTITSRASGFLRNQVRFTGTVPSRDAGQTVEIQRLGHQTQWTWANTAHAAVGPSGSFTVVWRANHIGRFAFRAIVQRGIGARVAAASPAVTVTVYRIAYATLYGPGLYGNRTACGYKLTRSTIGIANRTLRCGEKVALYYHGRTILVPVIDRGPYAHGADFDLTMATGRALGLSESADIGAVSVPSPPSRFAATLS